MRLWRLSSARRARDFGGGYGLANHGRWNTRGRAVTYCSTVPSLAALEKRVHVTSPALLPPQVMVAYDLPDSISRRVVTTGDLAADWNLREAYTQEIGDLWLDSAREVLLFVPSVVVALPAIPDQNVLINHRAAGADAIRIAQMIPSALDPRLFRP